MSDEQLAAIEGQLTVSDGRLTAIEGRLTSVAVKLDRLDTQVQDLGHQMRMLHEDTIDKIKALAPDSRPLRREFTAADAQLREDIERRLDPLEAFARSQRDKSAG